MSDAVTQRTEREDFQATRDPAVMESADTGQVNLLTYAELYRLWERQSWASHQISLEQDRRDWASLHTEERESLLWGLEATAMDDRQVIVDRFSIAQAPRGRPELERGAMLFKVCAACHGADGRG